jgi:hypothetical protein
MATIARTQRTQRKLVVLSLLTLGFTANPSLPASAPPTGSHDAQAGDVSSLSVPASKARRREPSTVATASAARSLTPPSDPNPDGIAKILASFAASGSYPVLVGAGDIGDCSTGASFATAALIEAIPGLVFTAGDEAYPEGSAEDFDDCYEPSWGRFRDRTLPTIGNHEYLTPGAVGYFGYFDDVAGRLGRAWYSLDVGAWHVIILDSDCDIVGCGRGSAQLAWLKADLAADSNRCTLAIWHHPRFSSGGHGNDPAVAPFWRALMAAGAELVVNGHDHDYERFAPQTPRGRLDRGRGIREIVAGTGGASLRWFHRVKANSKVRLREHGVLQLTLRPAGYSWQFQRTDGSIGDAGTTRCH